MAEFEEQEPRIYSTLRMNCLTAIHTRLPRRTTFPSGIGIFVPKANLSALADVTVYTEPMEMAIDQCATNPTLILEVGADPETTGKFALFRMAPSLREHVLVAVDGFTAVRRRRMPDGQWELTRFEGESATLALESLDLRIPFPEIYRNAIIDGKCAPS